MAREARPQLDLLLLATLGRGPAHGYRAIELMRERSGGYFAYPEGTVYPALHRLERDGLVTSEWSTGAARRRRIYRADAGRPLPRSCASGRNGRCWPARSRPWSGRDDRRLPRGASPTPPAPAVRPEADPRRGRGAPAGIREGGRRGRGDPPLRHGARRRGGYPPPWGLLGGAVAAVGLVVAFGAAENVLPPAPWPSAAATPASVRVPQQLALLCGAFGLFALVLRRAVPGAIALGLAALLALASGLRRAWLYDALGVSGLAWWEVAAEAALLGAVAPSPSSRPSPSAPPPRRGCPGRCASASSSTTWSGRCCICHT